MCEGVSQVSCLETATGKQDNYDHAQKERTLEASADERERRALTSMMQYRSDSGWRAY